MVDFPSGKMKSREGTVVDADDLMVEMQQTASNPCWIKIFNNLNNFKNFFFRCKNILSKR